MEILKFESISDIIKKCSTIYPDSSIEKTVDSNGKLKLIIKRRFHERIYVEIRDCQGSGCFLAEIPTIH